MANEIIITKEDRKKYGLAANTDAKNESVALNTELDKFEALSQPIDIPKVPTIYDMKMEDQLPEKYEAVLTQLSDLYPKANFENLTPLEAIQVQEYNATSKNMDRKEIWKLIKPFFNSVFNQDLGDQLSKMTEIARRCDNDLNYTPTYEWLTIIAKRILDARNDLFIYNIDLAAKRFNHVENPIEFLLMLMKVQKEMYPKRNSKLSKTFFDKFLLLMQSHAELMIKLKMNNKSGEDFFGSKYNKIKSELRVLKSVSYRSFGGKPLTVKQQATLINIIDDYKKTLELIFSFNPDDKVFFEEHLYRPNKDAKLAALEAYHTFDDSSNNGNDFRLKMLRYDKTACEIINSIYLSGSYGKAMNNMYKNGISMQHLTDYIEQYFSFDDATDRHIIKQKTIGDKTETPKIIIEQFFEILDKYIS